MLFCAWSNRTNKLSKLKPPAVSPFQDMNAIDIVVVKKLIGRNVIEMLWNEDGVVNERELDYTKGQSNPQLRKVYL